MRDDVLVFVFAVASLFAMTMGALAFADANATAPHTMRKMSNHVMHTAAAITVRFACQAKEGSGDQSSTVTAAPAADPPGSSQSTGAPHGRHLLSPERPFAPLNTEKQLSRPTLGRRETSQLGDL
jgi:hypothetical protein